MKRTTLAIIIAIAATQLTACVSWQHPYKTGKEAQNDIANCRYEADKYSFVAFGSGTSPISAGVQQGLRKSSLMSQCMEMKGYRMARNK